MPTAELIKPKSYNHLGRIWKQGVEVEVTQELAAELEDNPRFRIRGFGVAREAEVQKPTVDAAKPKGSNVKIKRPVKKDVAAEEAEAAAVHDELQDDPTTANAVSF